MPTFEVNIPDDDLALLGTEKTSLIEQRLSELIGNALSELAEEFSAYPDVVTPIRQARLRLVSDPERPPEP